MTVELFRGYNTLEPPPQDWASNPPVVELWCRRRASRVNLLEARGDYIQDGWGGWSAIYVLGMLYGWKPAGTNHPDTNWAGDYFSNDGATVREADALALAAALKCALGDTEGVSQRRLSDGASTSASALVGQVERVDDALRLLTDLEGQNEVRRYVRFLERGSFTIE